MYYDCMRVELHTLRGSDEKKEQKGICSSNYYIPWLGVFSKCTDEIRGRDKTHIKTTFFLILCSSLIKKKTVSSHVNCCVIFLLFWFFWQKINCLDSECKSATSVFYHRKCRFFYDDFLLNAYGIVWIRMHEWLNTNFPENFNLDKRSLII